MTTKTSYLFLKNNLRLFFALLFFVPQFIYTQNFDVINFEKQDYHAASQNWSIADDTNGFIYVGNNMGLLEFDGISWKLYPSPNGSVIRAVNIDKNNRIYTGGYRELGYWERKNDGVIEYNSLSAKVEDKFTTNEEFWNIFITDSSVFFHSFSSIYVYKQNEFNVIKPGSFISYVNVIENEFIFSIKNKGLFKITNNNYVPYIANEWFTDKTIRFVCKYKTPDKFIIITESKGLFIFDKNTNEFTPFAVHLNSHFIQNKINKVLKNDNHELIIGTLLDGITILNLEGKLLNRINSETGLQSNTVLGLKPDKYCNTWVALNKGIDFISFDTLKALTKVQKIEIGAVHTAAIYNNDLYIGTNQGLYKKKWGDNHSEFKLVPNTQEQVWDCKIIDNSLFVGHNAGTFLIEGNEKKKISNYSGGYSIIQSPLNPDLLIQSTYSDFVVYTKKAGHWQFSHTLKGYNNLIRCIEFDHLNNLWASHLYQGLYKINLNDKFDSIQSIKNYGKNSILLKESRNISVFKVANRIVFTTGENLFTYNDLIDSIVPYTLLNEKIGVYSKASKIIPAPGNRYWFISKYGIACFEIQMNVVKKVKEYPIPLFQNQLIPLYENIIPIDKNRAIVCLENGYSILNTTAENKSNIINSFKLHLQEFTISDNKGREYPLPINDSKAVIPFYKNNLSFRYSFPLFSAEEIKFQYKIQGLSGKWSEKYEKPIFSIKRIPPGDYILSVKAVNNWGESSRVHRTIFTIKPPMYQSKLAYLCYLILFVFFALLVRHLSVRKVKLREKNKRKEKEKELIKLRNEKLKSELSFKSQQIASSTMGIIKKNEFLLSLKDRLRKHKEQLGTRYPDKYYQNIVDKIDENITGQDDWKLFESNFEQAHETFLLNLKSEYPELTSSDLRLCAYLRINLTSKEIAPLLGISVRGVENHRYRLRKKLNVSSEESLTDFILTL